MSDAVLITVVCPHCRREARVRRSAIGRKATCPCGGSFVVAERHTHECPHCGQEYKLGAEVCPRCGKDLARPPLPHQTHSERPEKIDPADYETDQVRQDLEHRLQHQRRVRRTRRLLLLCSLPFVAWGLWSWLDYRAAGKLPTVAQVQKDMKLWPLEARPGILRGRPLTEVPFTNDASRKLSEPVLELYLDNEELVVAMSCTITVYRDIDDNRPYTTARERAKLLDLPEPNVDAARRYVTLCEFAQRYLSPACIDVAESTNVLRSNDDPYDKDPNFICNQAFWRTSRYDCDLTLLSRMNHPDPEQREYLTLTTTWIVRGRDW